MKNIHIYSITGLLLAAVVAPSYISAQTTGAAVAKAPESVNLPANASAKAQNATATKNNVATSTDATSTEATKISQGGQHKSTVAVVVQKLLSVADRDGGIGAEVRLIAQEQASTSDKVKKDMDEIANENPLKRFFFGTSYKNTGELRSTVVTTQNHITRLKKALEKTTSTTTKVELSAQIAELEKVASSTETFIKTNESKFSIFGWFNKFISK